MKLPVVSGESLIKFLTHHGFIVVRQHGSHVTLKRVNMPHTHVTVPLHNTLKKGTLLNILNQAEIDKTEFTSKI
ncbi:MAG: type II toxin-antitoxin system HicA family toxin [Candidatus Altiarchaeota archaeon]